jgi:hypothetical protein
MQNAIPPVRLWLRRSSIIVSTARNPECPSAGDSWGYESPPCRLTRMAGFRLPERHVVAALHLQRQVQPLEQSAHQGNVEDVAQQNRGVRRGGVVQGGAKRPGNVHGGLPVKDGGSIAPEFPLPEPRHLPGIKPRRDPGKHLAVRLARAVSHGFIDNGTAYLAGGRKLRHNFFDPSWFISSMSKAASMMVLRKE